MKKKISLSLALIICLLSLCALLCGCGDGDNSEITGKWTATSASINGETILFSELNAENKEFSFTFESNGKCTAVIAGIRNNGSYTFNKTSVDIVYGDKTEKLLYDDGILTMNFYYNNETTAFMFTKEN